MTDLTLLILPEGSHYVAQCLEHDFAAQGQTMVELKNRVKTVLRTFHELSKKAGYSLLDRLDPAPSWYQDQSKTAQMCDERWVFTFDGSPKAERIGVAPVMR